MSGVHAPLAPSSADIWVHCAGSVSLSAGVVEEETDDSRAGDAAHWLASEMLTTPLVPTVGMVTPNGVIVDEEMIDCVEMYVDRIKARGLPLNVEKPIKIPYVHEQNYGTPDNWSWDGANHTIYVDDFKYGHGAIVAVENWQLMDYAIGIAQELGVWNTDIEFEFCIAQPRCYSDGLGVFRTWSIHMIDLKEYAEDLRRAAEEAMGDNPTLSVGNHCHYCKGRYRCPAITQAAAAYSDYAQAAVPHELSVEALGYELQVLRRAADTIRNRLSGIETDAMNRITSGIHVPGFDTKRGMSNNNWLRPIEEVQALGQLMNVNFMSEPKPSTPTQACKKLKDAGIDAQVIKSYYGKTPTSMKLVVDDGSRAKQIFSKPI